MISRRPQTHLSNKRFFVDIMQRSAFSFSADPPSPGPVSTTAFTWVLTLHFVYNVYKNMCGCGSHEFSEPQSCATAPSQLRGPVRTIVVFGDEALCFPLKPWSSLRLTAASPSPAASVSFSARAPSVLFDPHKFFRSNCLCAGSARSVLRVLTDAPMGIDI